jgi:GR25 family glycosyltransferase involved in LPS biosynthesis
MAEPGEWLNAPVCHPCPADPSCPYCNGSSDRAERPLDWSFLDAAYCTSLKTRDDRAAEPAAEFHRIGLCQRVTFYRPDKHPKHGFIGIWASHRDVALDALQRGCARTLICEDDVLFTRRIRPRTLSAIERALRALPPDWMIFFLGHWPLAAYFVRHNVLRTSSGCAHAYIASPHLLRWLRDHPWGSPGVEFSRIAGKGVDSAYAMLPAAYALFPMLAIQRVSKSDNFDDPAIRKSKKKTRLKHLVTRSAHRELLLSKLMRPFEMIVALLSPAFFLAERLAGRGTLAPDRDGENRGVADAAATAGLISPPRA